MFADYTFNGYEITTSRGRKYPAVALDFHGHISEGMFTIAASGNSFSKANVTMSAPQAFSLTDASAPRTTSRFSLRNTKSAQHQGILVDNGLFRDEKLEGKTLSVRYSNPWMRTAMNELGVAETQGAKATQQILEYYKAANYSSQTSDEGDGSAWCACYVSWVLAQHKYPISPHAMGALAYREWQGVTYGQSLDAPVYGALAVKERKATITVDGVKKTVTLGHIGFVMGQSPDGKYLFILGGNQNDQVSVSKTLRTDWVAFRMPPGFGYAAETLPVYIGDAVQSSRES